MQPSISGDQREGVSEITAARASEVKARPKYIQASLVILKILAGIALLILSIQGIQIKDLTEGIRSAQLAWLSIAVLSILLGLGAKLWRWGVLVRNYQIRISLARLFSAYFVGQAANIVLPFRGGLLVRLVYFVDEKESLPAATSTILLEKYLDLLALTVTALIVSFKLSLENVLNLQGWLLPITIAITVLFFAAIILGPTIWGRIFKSNLLPIRLSTWVNAFVEASQWLRNPLLVMPTVFLTILIWGIMWLTNLFLFKSLGIPINGTAGGLVLVLVYIGILPGMMPGNIGPFYFFGSLALIPFGVLHNQAIVFAVLLHAIVNLPALLGGAIGLFIHSPPHLHS